MIGSLDALNAAHSSAAMTTSPMAPITVGLRLLNERPRGARRVFIAGFSVALGGVGAVDEVDIGVAAGGVDIDCSGVGLGGGAGGGSSDGSGPGRGRLGGVVMAGTSVRHCRA